MIYSTTLHIRISHTLYTSLFTPIYTFLFERETEPRKNLEPPGIQLLSEWFGAGFEHEYAKHVRVLAFVFLLSRTLSPKYIASFQRCRSIEGFFSSGGGTGYNLIVTTKNGGNILEFDTFTEIWKIIDDVRSLWAGFSKTFPASRNSWNS